MTKEVKTLLLVGGIVVGVVGILIAVSQLKSANEPVASEAVIREDSHVLGAEDAPATLVEFGDYQCPACAAAEPMIKQLQADFGDDLRFSFRNFPLLSIHPNAMDSAKAAEAAAKQDKFWEMHDLLYEQQSAWSGLANPDDQFKAYAGQLDMDEDQFMSDYRSQEIADRVNRDFDDGGALGVNATPTFYLNGEKVQDHSYDALKAQIEDIIAGSDNAEGQDTQATESSSTEEADEE